jgi:hypothetical protein
MHRYGGHHKAMRERYGRLVAAGKAFCARCRKPIDPGEPWDLDHVTGGRPGEYLGPSHRACNRAEPFKTVWARGKAAKPKADRFGGLPDPDPGNMVDRWSRHWAGGFNPRCPDCRRLGGPCEEAEVA